MLYPDSIHQYMFKILLEQILNGFSDQFSLAAGKNSKKFTNLRLPGLPKYWFLAPFYIKSICVII